MKQPTTKPVVPTTLPPSATDPSNLPPSTTKPTNKFPTATIYAPTVSFKRMYFEPVTMCPHISHEYNYCICC